MPEWNPGLSFLLCGCLPYSVIRCEQRLAIVFFHCPQGADRCYFQTLHLWLIHKVEPTSYFQLLKYLPRRTDHSRLRSTVSSSPSAQPVHAHTLPPEHSLSYSNPAYQCAASMSLGQSVSLSRESSASSPALLGSSRSVGLLHALPPSSSLEHLTVSGLPYPPV